MMVLFEKSCANWGFDLTKDDKSPYGVIYTSFQTGVMFSMIDAGFDAAKEHFGVKD